MNGSATQRFSRFRMFSGVLAAFCMGTIALPGFYRDSEPDARSTLTVRAPTRGGVNGKVIKVTTLSGDGPGSLRAAISEKGPRVVIFEVGGVIDLERQPIRILEPQLTLAGQTAPDPGITLIRGGVEIATHDVVVQHLAVRPGDAGQPARSGWSPDGINLNGASRVFIDHCSATWAVDENLSVSGPRYDGPLATSHDVLILHCLIAEALNRSSHEKGPHSKGSLVHDQCRNVAVVGNLYAHNVDRNPFFKAETTGAVVNNLIYNPGRVAVRVSFPASEWTGRALPGEGRLSVVGNVLIAGRDTRLETPLVMGTGEVFARDNLAFDRNGSSLPVLAPEIRVLREKPFWPEGLTALAAQQVLRHVVRNAGSRPWRRDPIDDRIVASVLKRDGRIIDSQNDAGGYPAYAGTARLLTPPREGLEAWLTAFAESGGGDK